MVSVDAMERARNSLQKLAATLLRAAPPKEAPVLAWPLVCGGSVAQRTSAEEFVNGVLTVMVQDKAWRKQLEDFVPQYLVYLNSIVDAEVKQIRFVVQSKAKGIGVGSL